MQQLDKFLRMSMEQNQTQDGGTNGDGITRYFQSRVNNQQEIM